MNPRYEQLAAQIKTARLRKGLSQERAAQLVGTSRFHWIRWEQGLHMPTGYREKLIEVLGLPADVFGDDGEDGEEDPVAALMTVALMTAVRIVVRRELDHAQIREVA